MSLVKMNTSQDPREQYRHALIAYESLIYPVFLIVAILGRLLPRFGSKARAGSRPSAFAEAANLTESVVPWFFVHR